MENEKAEGVQLVVCRIDDALGGLDGLMDLLCAAETSKVGASGVRAILAPVVGEIREARQELKLLL